MAGMSVGGLVSGMDTATIVSQLMEVEAQPQTLLKNQLSSAQSKATAYRAINTRFDALRSAAESLTTDAVWQSAKATASSNTVTATAAAGATPSSVTFTVNDVARAHSEISAQKWTATGTQTSADLAYGSDSLDITVGGVTTAVALDRNADGTTTLDEAAAAINARTDLGIRATVVKVSATDYRLQLSNTKAGAASAFSAGAAADFDTVTTGTDAKITIGSGSGYTMTSATNTFTGLIDGTTITVSEPIANVTLKVAADPGAVSDKVSALVSAANGLLDAISSYTAADSKSAVLKGDSTLRQLSSQILDVLSYAVGGDGSASAVGLELSKNGTKFEFDSAAFTAALAADPTKVKRMFTSVATTGAGVDGLPGTADDPASPVGLAAKLKTLALGASDAATGSLTLLATSTDAKAEDIEDRISNWDTRLELRRTALERQFTAMEKALSNLQNQGQWLSSQIKSLPSWSSSDN
jgi:flagellar hook-associated protein 2